MPLIKTASDATRSKNIAAEVRAGRPKSQAVAIAYRIQRDAKRKKMARGGKVAGYAPGGSIPFQTRSQARQLERAGMINSSVAGRTDKLPMGVKAGAFVFPADVVSGLGQGNSISGARALDRLFKVTPGGAAMASPMRPRARKGFADGGEVGAPVDILAAGGEYIVPPEVVAELGSGSLERGHDVLDSMVKQVRKKTIKTLRKLPGPKKK